DSHKIAVCHGQHSHEGKFKRARSRSASFPSQARTPVVALHAKGDFFGEGCLTGQLLRPATVTAMTECVIMRIGKDAIVRVLHEEPKFSETFVSYLLARNARVE